MEIGQWISQIFHSYPLIKTNALLGVKFDPEKIQGAVELYSRSGVVMTAQPVFDGVKVSFAARIVERYFALIQLIK